MTERGPNDLLDRHTLTLPAELLVSRSFLLGNRAGFALYLPVSTNERDATLQGSKWYGASGFGQSFLEGFVTWVEVDGKAVVLDRANQTGFIMRLDEAIRVFQVAGHEVRERYFVPDGAQSVVMSLEGDFPFGVRPELDMRYYQSFNSDFTSYACELADGRVLVRNRVTGVGPLKEDMNFFGALGTVQSCSVELLPPDQRLIPKTYLKDERREKAIESVYSETRHRVPDEAPLWDQYSTKVYSPASLRGHGPLTLICSFGDMERDVCASFEDVKAHLQPMRAAKRAIIATDLTEGMVETGNKDVDDAYAHVLTRFNDCPVVRDAVFQVSGTKRSHYHAIFAGNKYFMDAWKRDENISLRALLAINDYETVRAILDSTWQFQDEHTGRLPQIIRAGEALVYHSSDGTLWALRRLFEYTCQSGDTSLLKQKLAMVEHFFRASMNFAQRGLLPSGGIVDKQYLWETWEDTPFTPRDGYPVEIELLWLTVLADCADWVDDHALTKQMGTTLEEGRQTFEQFYGDGYLFDSLSYDWTPRPSLTPNGYIAFDLKYPLPANLESTMVSVARDQLAGRRGVRSLAPRDWPTVFPESFLDDPRSHTGKNMASFGIFNYHRGIEWEWLNPSFVAGELKWGDAQHAYEHYTKGLVDEALHEAGIGGLSELYDEHGPLGADFQAWSMAALIDAVHLYTGITIDAGTKSIRLTPWIPSEWPFLHVRRRIGELRFDLQYEQVSPLDHRLRIYPTQGDSGGYTVTIGIRVDPGRGIISATCNGNRISAREWTYEDGGSAGTGNRAWLTLPLHGDVDLHVKSG
jgi:hypothetical protein